MKSNEEFIAGIYKKAATYTEEKETKIIKVNWVAKATRIAAIAAVCIGLAGIGSLVFGNGSKVPNEIPQPGDENYGILLSFVEGDASGEAALDPARFRAVVEAATISFTGVVESVDAEEKRICIRVEGSENKKAYIKWDMLEPVSEKILVGTTLTATGALSEYNGCTELVLTDVTNLEIK